MPAISPTRITDGDNPKLPLPFRVFNAASAWPVRRFVSLDAENLLPKASRQTGLADFGDDRFREPLAVLLRAVQTDTVLSPFGRFAARCTRALAGIDKVIPLFSAMHEFTVEGPHEEIQLLATDFSTMLFEGSYHVPSYGAWYKRTDQKATYGYLKRCLKALQFLRRGERWLLKSPQHLENLEALVSAFPDATFIQTHRDPVRITASLTTMVAYGARMQEQNPNVRAIARYWSRRTEDLLRAGVRDCELLPESNVMDVHFHEFMADMPGTVKRIFEFADHPFTKRTALAIDAFLADNPRGKHGIIDYRLEDLGLDTEERRRALAFYRERFYVPED